MKKLFTIFATFAMLCAVGCEEQGGGDDIDPNDKTEQPEEKPEDPIPENIFFGLDKESVTISPDGGSVDVIVYSNYKWEISGTSDWCTPSVKSGEANEDGQKVTFSADVTYDTREAIFWFRCADEKIKFIVSQNLKEVIIADENNTFSVSYEGGIVTIAYQTSVECEVIIPEEAKSWITIAPADATRGLVAESVKLNIAENATYSARSAVVKVVKVGDNTLFAEYTINQVQNDAIIADNNNTFNVPSEGGVVEVAYQTNVECKVVIPEEAKSWITIAPADATRGLVAESVKLNIAENATYSARSAVVKVVKKGDNSLFAEYTINQEQNDAIVADTNNTFTVPSNGGNVTIDYQTNVECEIIIPEEAQDWLSLAPATRALVSESATLTVAENTTYSERSAVVKVVKVGDNTLFAEYTINQVQNDAIIADKNTTFNIDCSPRSVTLGYKTNVECDVIIPEEAQSWISIAPKTRALVDESTTLNIAANDTGAERSAIVKVVAKSNDELYAEYTINQDFKCRIEYISNDGKVVKPYKSSAFDASIISNTYNNGIGVIEFDKPITSIGSYAFSGCSSLTSITIPDSVTSIGDSAFSSCSSLTSITIPEGVTSIGDWAFAHCTSLTNVTIGNSVTSIGDRAFYNCSSLKSITIPDSVTSIGDDAFENCTSLTSFYGKFASKDGRCLVIDGVLNSFAPAGLTKYTIPDSVTEIRDRAFYGCSSLTSVIIPDSVTSIGSYAFSGCTSLTSITIPDSVTSIGNHAFRHCTSLKSVTIPDSVTSIGRYAFDNCKSLTSVYCKPTTPPTGGSYMFDYNASGREIYVPRASVNAYKAAEGWSDYKSYIYGYDF